jgi:Holliday junction resolvasome RuvABC endonuclease subunit
MIISIDPGLNFCGISVIEFNEKPYIHKTILIDNNRRLTEEEKKLCEKYDSRVIKVQEIINTINALIEQYSIEYIVIEGPFYSGLRPQAYSALLEIITAIKYLVAIPNGISLSIVEPLLVKKLFSNFHMSTKEDMRVALDKRVQEGVIGVDSSINIHKLSEHEIDSIAVGFSFFNILQIKGDKNDTEST